MAILTEVAKLSGRHGEEEAMARGRKGWELTHCSDTGWAVRAPLPPFPCPLYWGGGGGV